MEKNIFTFKIKINEIRDYHINPNYVSDGPSGLQDKIIEMKGRSRRGNIQVDGVTEEKRETWEDCEKNVLEILRYKLVIECAHRVKPYQNFLKNNKGQVSPTTIICKLLNYPDFAKV